MQSLSQIYAALSQFDSSQALAYPVTVLSNQTLHTLEPYLQFFLHQRQIAGKFQYGDYDNVLQECLKPVNSILNTKTACILLLLNPFKISATLNEETILRYITSCLKGIRNKTDALILVYTFNQLAYPAEGILGEVLHNGVNSTIRKLNAQLEEKLAELHHAYIVNLDLCLMRVGESAYYDLRSLAAFQNPYSLQAYEAIALETAKYIWAARGKTKKCLVLDADHVLWGGILGEDSWDKIPVYQEFQKNIIALQQKGVILALCSKNNEADLWQFLEAHPDMLLQRHHFAAYQINWQDKADNLKKIAEELNIALESMVFVDDTLHEIEWVRGHLPEVSTLHLPVETAHLNSQLLLAMGYFDRLSLTDEDTQRTRHYQEQKQRATLSRSYENIEAFLEDLNLELMIQKASPAELKRLAQLTQKTNQFNLTTRRYNESQMLNLIQSNQSAVFYAQLKDKFGDFGIIGLAIVHQSQVDLLEIDSLLLSCRALGRGVEDCLLNVVMHEACLRQAKCIHAEYLATSANQQTASFYEKHGFTPTFQSPQKTCYQINSQSYPLVWPDYYHHLKTPYSQL